MSSRECGLCGKSLADCYLDTRRRSFIHAVSRDAALRGVVLTADEVEALWQAHIASEDTDA